MMKTDAFSPAQIKRETLIGLICLGISVVINLAAIIVYQTRWQELYTQLGYVLVMGMVLYVLTLIVRIGLGWIRILRKK